MKLQRVTVLSVQQTSKVFISSSLLGFFSAAGSFLGCFRLVP